MTLKTWILKQLRTKIIFTNDIYKRIVILLFFGLNTGFLYSQNQQIQWIPLFNEEPIELGKSYKIPTQEDSVTFQAIKFYISDIELFRGNKKSKSLKKNHYLFDLEKLESMSIEIPLKAKVSQLQFILGVDSTTQYSSSMHDDLDPIYGMYWTWQSGYINIKIEAKSQISGKEYTYHIGGFQNPYNTEQTVQLEYPENGKIFWELKDLWEWGEKNKLFELMSPDEKAVEISDLLSHSFYVNP